MKGERDLALKAAQLVEGKAASKQAWASLVGHMWGPSHEAISEAG